MGSSCTRAGFAGDDMPIAVFPTVIGKPKIPTSSSKEIYVANEALDHRAFTITHPVRKGVIENWDDINEIVFHATTNQLKISTETYPIIFAESPTNTKQRRLKLASMLFEEFKIIGLFFGVNSLLSLYSTGKTSGLVLDSGDGITNAVPMYEGYYIPDSVKSSELCGQEVTRNLIR